MDQTPRYSVDSDGNYAVWIDQPVPEGLTEVAEIPPHTVLAPLTREAFCVALIGAGILTEAEAIDAALGTWPPKFEPALMGKPLVDKLTIKNVWRDTKTVARDAPLFLDLLAYYAAAMGLTSEQAAGLSDMIFARQ